MPHENDTSVEVETVLAVPGVLCVTPATADQNVVRLGAAAGWMIPAGIMGWERELSFIARGDMSTDLARGLRATMPHEQIASKRFPSASRAVASSPLLPIASELVDETRKFGVRVYTVGVDRVSSGFYYFAEGGDLPPVSVQDNLIEILAPSLTSSSSNADIATLLEGLLDRVVEALSGGLVSELNLELADALPRLSRNAMGLVGTDLEAFDSLARSLATRSARYENAARRLAGALAEAARSGQTRADVPLYGEAKLAARDPLKVLVAGQTMLLPAQPRWLVRGAPREEAEPAAVKPAARAPAARPPINWGDPTRRSDPALESHRLARASQPDFPARARLDSRPQVPAAAERRAPSAPSFPAESRDEGPAIAPQAVVVLQSPAQPEPPLPASPQPQREPERIEPVAEALARPTVEREPSPVDAKPAAAAKPVRRDIAHATARTPLERPAPRPSKPASPHADVGGSLAVFVIGLIALAAAISYSVWRWWHWHQLQ